MKQHSEHIISPAFNTATGYIPVVISIVLGELIPQNLAIYVGVGIGVLEIFRNLLGKTKKIPNFILFIVTGLLGILSLTTLLPSGLVPNEYYPITVEASLLLILQTFYLYKKEILKQCYVWQREKGRKRLYGQACEATIVTTRMTLILGMLHLITICIVLIFSSSSGVSPTVNRIVFQQIPFWIFVACILFNYLAIYFFNRLVTCVEYIPIVNEKGTVTGKTALAEAITGKDKRLHPVIRIAIAIQGRLYIIHRRTYNVLEPRKADIPIEAFPYFNEDLQDTIQRSIQTSFPDIKSAPRRHVMTYHFKNEETNRLVYLFLLEVEDERLLHNSPVGPGKVWNLEQIRDNLGKNYFSSYFEREFNELQKFICKEEKCTES